MFKKIIEPDGRIRIEGLGKYSLRDTLECGQCFRHVDLTPEGAPEGTSEYITVIGQKLVRVSQPERGVLVFHGADDETFEGIIRHYFSLDRSLAEVKEDIVSRTESDFLINAAESGEGIAILGQDPWETLVSFIISQNNNIPRIKGIIRKISAEYGVNLSLHRSEADASDDSDKIGENYSSSGNPCEVLSAKGNNTKCENPSLCEDEPREASYVLCPLKGDNVCSAEECRSCGICYTFPSAEQILANPEGLLPSKCGFRYGYILAAAEAVYSGKINLSELMLSGSFEEVMEKLKEIRGVGDKVASCVALFGLGRLEAFPVDVWMKRAIDTYFNGELDPTSLGKYAGIAQQYIFHRIRNIETE